MLITMQNNNSLSLSLSSNEINKLFKEFINYVGVFGWDPSLKYRSLAIRGRVSTLWSLILHKLVIMIGSLLVPFVKPRHTQKAIEHEKERALKAVTK
jgi:hypothetical protein